MNKRHDLENHRHNCDGCGEDFKQYHPKHIYCSRNCEWDHKEIPTRIATCKVCGCTDRTSNRGKTYCCQTCHKIKLNPERTDVTPREPTAST